MVKRRRGYKRSWNAPLPVENPDVAGLPARLRFSRALLDETRAVWQSYFSEPLSDEDCGEIIDTMTSYARLVIGGVRRDARARASRSEPGD
jgi:hypothetical protein